MCVCLSLNFAINQKKDIKEISCRKMTFWVFWWFLYTFWIGTQPNIFIFYNFFKKHSTPQFTVSVQFKKIFDNKYRKIFTIEENFVQLNGILEKKSKAETGWTKKILFKISLNKSIFIFLKIHYLEMHFT